MTSALLLSSMLAVPLICSRAAELAPVARLERLRDLDGRLQSGALAESEKAELLHALIQEVLASRQGRPVVSEAPPVPAGAGDKVIAVYGDRNTTKLVIEARKPLVAGAPVYAGAKEVEVTLQELLSRSGDLYYYAASTPGRAPVGEGDTVITRRTHELSTPSPLRLKVSETYTFEQKKAGEVTAVQEGRAMIDRGTLHEVRERDIYQVFDGSGVRKGFLEIHGIGDLQSSGVLYNRVEDRRKDAFETAPGDRVVFMGQRKLFGLGALYGPAFRGRTEFGATEGGYGLGLLWNLMFKNGWGVEVLFGTFERKLEGKEVISIVKDTPIRVTTISSEVDWKASYMFPVALKKNFFFPSVVSPFFLAGASYYNAKLVKNLRESDPASTHFPNSSDVRAVRGIAPMLGGGVEFYPARLIRPRVDLRWFTGPAVHTADKTMRMDKLFLSFSVVSAW